jgi:hypothetical protein
MEVDEFMKLSLEESAQSKAFDSKNQGDRYKVVAQHATW